jgi:Domain of unknown function (DUF4167)
VNNNFMRSNQNKNNNNNRNRNRNNNRRNTGTGGGGSGNNKVFDSNGPDIKLRGTTQTIAEKYMQLGRDAQSSGDGVAAENYYQHAEHYYRLWAANQPVGHSLQMSRRLGEEEFEEEGDDQAGGEDEGDQSASDVAPVEGTAQAEVDPNAVQTDGQQPRQSRNANFRDNNNRDNTNRNFRPRWQNNRNNRNYDNRDAAPVTDQNGPAPVDAVAEQVTSSSASQAVEPDGQWEAPSFLQRPSAAVAESPELAGPVEAAPRKYRPRKPKVEAEAVAVGEDSSGTDE